MSSIHASCTFPTFARRLALIAAGSSLVATAALGAGPANVADPQAVYQKDRAACLSGATNQDRDTCLREAGAALQQARGGGLDDSQARSDQNRLLRCNNQPPQDRDECIRRMNGEGTTTGSAQAGGMSRELVTPMVAPPKGN